MKILMVAAENGTLPGGKVGGMGDVIRDIPVALARQGHQVDVIMPGYQHFSRLPGASLQHELEVSFRGQPHTLQMFDVPEGASHDGVRCRVLDHPQLAPAGEGRIYCDDPPDRPFAADASKFALFCTAVAEALLQGQLEGYDVIHLHDWHAAMFAVLARYHPRYASLSSRHLVYTIHNLSLQGIRPLHGDSSSLHAWFPELICDTTQVRDPRYQNCVNPMRAAIRLCNRVHAVSPTYAGEIQQPSDGPRGYVGGEGLENDLRHAAHEGRLVGILNGCEYPAAAIPGARCDAAALAQLADEVSAWVGTRDQLPAAHYLAHRRLDQWLADIGGMGAVVTSVGRLTAQKVLLLRHSLSDGRTLLEHLLEQLQGRGRLLLLGSGDPTYEAFFRQLGARYDNLLFLNGYSESASELLYRVGDLFLMPSSFEPCGISQMLAMRAGQPCLVHGVGGLCDTVVDGETGFVFRGDSLDQQAQALLDCLERALQVHAQPAAWKAICKAAAAQRFLWSDAAEAYVAQLYSH